MFGPNVTTDETADVDITEVHSKEKEMLNNTGLLSSYPRFLTASLSFATLGLLLFTALNDLPAAKIGGAGVNGKNARVLLVSSVVRDHEILLAAARADVLVIRYNPAAETPDSLLGKVERALNGCKAASIGVVTHDIGEAEFQLCGGVMVDVQSVRGNPTLRRFWEGLGALIEPGGRIDLIACNLAADERGIALLSELESAARVDFAASTNLTGNPNLGGDWRLEYGSVDLVADYFDADGLGRYSDILANEVKKIIYPDLDYYGYDYSISGSSLSGSFALVGSVDATGRIRRSGAACVLYRTVGGPDNWGPVAQLYASDGNKWDDFGASVSLSGDWAIIGAPRAGKGIPHLVCTGAAYIFHRNRGGKNKWGQVAKLKAPVNENSYQFGRSVAIDGDLAAANATDGIYIFGRNKGGSNKWGLIQILKIENTSTYESVCISGEDILVDDRSCALIYSRCSGARDHWRLSARFKPQPPTRPNIVVHSIAMDDDYAIIGYGYYPYESSSRIRVFVYNRNAGGLNKWGMVAELVPPDAPGKNEFGYAVAIEDNIALVGAHSDFEKESHRGAVYFYKRSPSSKNSWAFIDKFYASDYNLCLFGMNISIDNKLSLIEGYEYAYIFNLASPVVKTPTATDITCDSAILGAIVTNRGSYHVSERGAVWSTSTNPTIEDHEGRAQTSGGTGVYKVLATGLAPLTTYYYRGYAVNKSGTAYSNVAHFTTD